MENFHLFTWSILWLLWHIQMTSITTDVLWGNLIMSSNTLYLNACWGTGTSTFIWRSQTRWLEYKHNDTATVYLITKMTMKWFHWAKEDSCPKGDFIPLFRMVHNSKLVNCVFLDFPLNIFRPELIFSNKLKLWKGKPQIKVGLLYHFSESELWQKHCMKFR